MRNAREESGMKRALSATNLTTLGIGAIIGAGIFVLTGQAAAQYAGPAIVISFIISGLACLFAGLCYAEFAGKIKMFEEIVKLYEKDIEAFYKSLRSFEKNLKLIDNLS